MLKISENGATFAVRWPTRRSSDRQDSVVPLRYTNFQFSAPESCRFWTLRRRFRPFRFKFRPKRSDFGRKKLRTAETGFGSRLSEVIPYLGERGAAFGGLQGVELENGFYPYSGWNSRNAPSAAVM